MDLKEKNLVEQELRAIQLQKEVGYHLKRSYVQVIEHFHMDMSEINLRPAEYSILSMIAENNHVTAKKLSKALNIAPPNLVNLIDLLESKQLVSKSVNESDRRSQILHLTTLGEIQLAKAIETSAKSQQEALSNLSPKEVGELIGLLRKVYS
jgi:DNA-binding MarR family transcriptional regulator